MDIWDKLKEEDRTTMQDGGCSCGYSGCLIPLALVILGLLLIFKG
jgi:hypothetical protein